MPIRRLLSCLMWFLILSNPSTLAADSFLQKLRNAMQEVEAPLGRVEKIVSTYKAIDTVKNVYGAVQYIEYLENSRETSRVGYVPTKQDIDSRSKAAGKAFCFIFDLMKSECNESAAADFSKTVLLNSILGQRVQDVVIKTRLQDLGQAYELEIRPVEKLLEEQLNSPVLADSDPKMEVSSRLRIGAWSVVDSSSSVEAWSDVSYGAGPGGFSRFGFICGSDRQLTVAVRPFATGETIEALYEDGPVGPTGPDDPHWIRLSNSQVSGKTAQNIIQYYVSYYPEAIRESGADDRISQGYITPGREIGMYFNMQGFMEVYRLMDRRCGPFGQSDGQTFLDALMAGDMEAADGFVRAALPGFVQCTQTGELTRTCSVGKVPRLTAFSTYMVMKYDGETKRLIADAVFIVNAPNEAAIERARAGIKSVMLMVGLTTDQIDTCIGTIQSYGLEFPEPTFVAKAVGSNALNCTGGYYQYGMYSVQLDVR